MGHTHYWTFTDKPNQAKYNNAKSIIGEFITYAIQRGYKLADGMGTEGTHPILKKIIAFNGVGEDGVETFYLDNKVKAGFNFCKTYEKPYDPVVVGCLLLLKGEMMDDVSVSSDGIGNLDQPNMYFDMGEGMGLLLDFINTIDPITGPEHAENIIKQMVNWFNRDNVEVQYDKIITKCIPYTTLLQKK